MTTHKSDCKIYQGYDSLWPGFSHPKAGLCTCGVGQAKGEAPESCGCGDATQVDCDDHCPTPWKKRNAGQAKEAHTPGPWNFCPNTDCGPCGNIYAEKRKWVGQAFGKLHAPQFASDPKLFANANEQLANAALMAAAPETAAERDRWKIKAQSVVDANHNLATEIDALTKRNEALASDLKKLWDAAWDGIGNLDVLYPPSKPHVTTLRIKRECEGQNKAVGLLSLLQIASDITEKYPEFKDTRAALSGEQGK